MLDDERSVSDLRRYFAPGAFTGSQFEALGTASKALHRDVVEAEDLIAVELLNARVPAGVALDLLQGDLGLRISDELRKIPLAVNLGDKTAKTYIEDRGPADRAWRLLTEHRGLKKAIAGKLLARKRPKLIPVYDDVVACALRGRPGYWLWLHEHLRAEDLRLAHRLRNLRVQADVPAEVSDIRIFDIVFWMRHQGDHQRRRCPGLAGFGPSL
ncbi:DUF6308 family protein [Micromonospora craterilacus]|uniref:DUF6308 family protein n=1 Tax=Micromonospora craterilacus TaxID=1655439 RepID=UPI0018F5DE13|nr:DUF6308 family protein [Micromonospora craterilacus]